MRKETLMKLVDAVAGESKCERRQVGAIIVKDGRIISTGYNGTPSGMPNCNEIEKDNHHEWQWNNEIHAEMNAVLFAARFGISIEGATMVTSLEPCLQCAKHLANSGIKSVLYKGRYEPSGADFLRRAGIEVESIEDENEEIM